MTTVLGKARPTSAAPVELPLSAKGAAAAILAGMLLGRFAFADGPEDSIQLPLQPITLALALVLTIAASGGRGRLGLPYLRPVAAWCLALLPLLASLQWSPAPELGSDALTGLVYPLSYVLLFSWLIEVYGNAVVTWMLALLMGIGALYAIVGLLLFSGERVALPGGGPNVYGRVTSLALIAAVYFASQPTAVHRLFRPFAFVAIPILGLATVLSGSRGAVVGLVGGLLILAIALSKRPLKMLALVLGTSALTGLILRVAPTDSYAQLVQTRYVDLWGYTSGRDITYQTAIGLIEQSPLAGHGQGAYPYYAGVADAYPHNLFLEQAVGAGLIGLVCLIGALAWILVSPATVLRKPGPQGAALALAISILIGAQVSGGLLDQRFLWFFGGMALLSAKLVPRPRDSGSLQTGTGQKCTDPATSALDPGRALGPVQRAASMNPLASVDQPQPQIIEVTSPNRRGLRPTTREPGRARRPQ